MATGYQRRRFLHFLLLVLRQPVASLSPPIASACSILLPMANNKIASDDKRKRLVFNLKTVF